MFLLWARAAYIPGVMTDSETVAAPGVSWEVLQLEWTLVAQMVVVVPPRRLPLGVLPHRRSSGRALSPPSRGGGLPAWSQLPGSSSLASGKRRAEEILQACGDLARRRAALVARGAGRSQRDDMAEGRTERGPPALPRGDLFATKLHPFCWVLGLPDASGGEGSGGHVCC